MRRVAWAVAGMVAVTLTVDTAELAALLRMSRHELRERFALPATCEPAVSATRRERRQAIEVRIDCVDTEPALPASPRSGR
jgi:hypothetical protein